MGEQLENGEGKIGEVKIGEGGAEHLQQTNIQNHSGRQSTRRRRFFFWHGRVKPTK